MRNAVLLMTLVACVAAAPVPSGSEFQVNTTTADNQSKPQVAMAGDGAFAVVWESADANKTGVFGQRYNASGSPLGAEFQVNTTTTGDQNGPVIGMAANGSFVVVWASKSDKQIMAQRFDASGNPLATEFSVSAISEYRTGFDTILGSSQSGVPDMQIATQITVLASGDVNSITAYVGGDNKGLRYALYSDSSGEPGSLLAETKRKKSGNAMGWVTIDLPTTSLTPGTYWLALAFKDLDQEYRYTSGGQTRHVNRNAADIGFASSWGTSDNSFTRQISIYADSSSEGTKPGIAMRDEGGFVVAWEGDDAHKIGVIAQRFDGSGNAIGANILVNTTTTGNQTQQDLAMNTAGSFVIAWQAPDANQNGIFAQRHDVSGNAVGGEFQVNTTTTGDQKVPSVAMADDGSFTVVWEGVDASLKGVFAQRHDASGNPVGGEFQVNTTTTGDQEKPSVTMDGDGNFTVVWEAPDANQKGVFAQHYDAAGNTVGGEFQVNTTTLDDQNQPRLAVGTGRFVVVWEGNDADKNGVFAQRYGLGKLVLKSWRSQGALTRQARFRTRRLAPGWTAPQKDLNYLRQLDPG